MDLENSGESFERRHGHVLDTAFNSAHVGAINLGSQRQSLLRQSSGYPQASQVPANGLPHVHAETKPYSQLDNRRTDSPILLQLHHEGH